MYKPNFQKRDVIVFRQFKRKGYSLFACLGREVIISVLSVATLSASKAASISDEVWRVDSTQTVKEVWLDDVGVTGSRAPLTTNQAARMVTVLTHDDIAQAPVQSINDLLKMAVGVDVRQRGAMGSQTDVSMRGGTQEQITILLNGINICDPQTGHNVLDLPIQLSEIIRIEVLEGPAGRTYGTSSLVGAINIVTHPRRNTEKDIPNIEVNLETGSFGYAKTAFVANQTPRFANHLTHQLSGSYARSDGFSRAKAGNLNTDYRGAKAFYQGQYATEAATIGWHLGIADKGWGSSTFYASPKWQADEQYEHTTKIFSALQLETHQGFIHTRSSLYWNQHQDRYEGYRGRPDLMKYNYNRCDIFGVSINNWVDWIAGRTAFGAELRNEDLLSGNLGEPLYETRHINGTDRDYTLGINRTNISAHAEHNIILDKLTLSAGFVATKSTWSKMNMSVYPGIDVSYRMNDNLKLFASWNTSLRLPSFTEMYYKLQGYAADPHLKPEEMQAIETGVQWHTDYMAAKATLYHHHGKNMIDWIMDTSLGSAASWESTNHTVINTYGLELYADLNLQKVLPSQNTFQSLSISYAYNHQDKQAEANIVSQYALEYLRHKIVGRLTVTPLKNVRLNLSGRFQDRVGSYTRFDGTVNEYRPYALFDARLSWQLKKTEIYGEVNNLLDNRSWVDFGNVPQPGIWCVIGTRFHVF
jgi:iron complex outermembrane receptor protein